MDIHIRSLTKVRALMDAAGFSGSPCPPVGPCVGQSSLSASCAHSGEGRQPGEQALPAAPAGAAMEAALGPGMEPQGRERGARLYVEGHSQGQRVEGPIMGANRTHPRRQGSGGRLRWMETQAGSGSRAPHKRFFCPQRAGNVLSTQPQRDGPQQGPRRCRPRGYLRAPRRIHAVSQEQLLIKVYHSPQHTADPHALPSGPIPRTFVRFCRLEEVFILIFAFSVPQKF